MVLSVIFCKVHFNSSKQPDIFEKVNCSAGKIGVFPGLQETTQQIIVGTLLSIPEQCLFCNPGLAVTFTSLCSWPQLKC